MEEALRQLPKGNVVSCSWHPFQLDPDMPSSGLDRKMYRSKKFGSWQQSQVLDEQVTQAGKGVGITFRYDLQTHTPNTFDSHRLVWLASLSGVQDAVVEALFRGYFCEGVNFSDQRKLIEIGVAAGMDQAKLERSLGSDESASAVRDAEQQARVLGLSGVPFYVINETVTISGAQPAKTFLEALLTAATPGNKSTDASPGGSTAICGPDGCEIPR
jgi:predicted DsbA family dithiol-disulfide isomerase